MIEASNSENVQDFTGMNGHGLAKALQMKKAFFCVQKPGLDFVSFETWFHSKINGISTMSELLA